MKATEAKAFSEALGSYYTTIYFIQWLRENGMFDSKESDEKIAYDFAIRFSGTENMFKAAGETK